MICLIFSVLLPEIMPDAIFLQHIHTAGIFLYETFFEVDYDHRTYGRDWKLKKKRSNKSLRLYFFS